MCVYVKTILNIFMCAYVKTILNMFMCVYAKTILNMFMYEVLSQSVHFKFSTAEGFLMFSRLHQIYHPCLKARCPSTIIGLGGAPPSLQLPNPRSLHL